MTPLSALRGTSQWRLPCALALASALLTSSPAAAQSQRAQTAVLLKRIAEAVDGYRGGEDLFVVASYDYPNEVVGVFPRRPDAEAAARLRGELGVFGPYRTLPDVDPLAPRPRFGCIHMGPSIMGPRYCPDLLMPIESIRNLALLVTGADGRQQTVPLPAGTDALFLGMPAIDKFVIPYYLRVVGLQGAGRMRAEFDSLFRSR